MMRNNCLLRKYNFENVLFYSFKRLDYVKKLLIKGGPVMRKHDFVFFEGEYLQDYTLWNQIFKYNVIFERKSYIQNYTCN